MKYELKNNKVLKDGHTMFIEDIVKDLNYYRNKFIREKIKNKMKFRCNACADTENSYYPCEFIISDMLSVKEYELKCPISLEECEWELMGE